MKTNAGLDRASPGSAAAQRRSAARHRGIPQRAPGPGIVAERLVQRIAGMPGGSTLARLERLIDSSPRQVELGLRGERLRTASRMSGSPPAGSAPESLGRRGGVAQRAANLSSSPGDAVFEDLVFSRQLKVEMEDEGTPDEHVTMEPVDGQKFGGNVAKMVDRDYYAFSKGAALHSEPQAIAHRYGKGAGQGWPVANAAVDEANASGRQPFTLYTEAKPCGSICEPQLKEDRYTPADSVIDGALNSNVPRKNKYLELMRAGRTPPGMPEGMAGRYDFEVWGEGFKGTPKQ